MQDIKQLNLGNKKLGDYLHNDCRNAIAHISGTKEGVKIKYDLISDNLRILKSSRIVEELARYFIINDLKIKRKLFLDINTDFPTYKVKYN